MIDLVANKHHHIEAMDDIREKILITTAVLMYRSVSTTGLYKRLAGVCQFWHRSLWTKGFRQAFKQHMVRTIVCFHFLL